MRSPLCSRQAYYQGGCRSQLYRLVADLATDTLESCEQQLQRTVEFPTYAWQSATGKPYRHAYLGADAVDHPVSWGPAQVRVVTPYFIS